MYTIINLSKLYKGVVLKVVLFLYFPIIGNTTLFDTEDQLNILSSNKSIIDLEAMKQEFDEDMPFIIDLLLDYPGAVENYIKNLSQAYQKQNINEVLNLTRCLMGTSIHVSALEMVSVLQELEKNIIENNIENLGEIISKIDPAFERIKGFVDKIKYL